MTESLAAQPDPGAIRTILFDLDGTFADTAPDLAYALNQVLLSEGRTELPYERIRSVVSHGGSALIRLGFGLERDAPQFKLLHQRLLDIYQTNICRGTRLFPGMEELVGAIEGRGMNWGIVTNKPSWLTNPLMQALGMSQRAACIVSGDTTATPKPHPAPILHGCSLAGSAAGECLYVGDAERDIAAGQRAGTATLVAMFGYLDETDQPHTWGANGLIDHPSDILAWLDR